MTKKPNIVSDKNSANKQAQKNLPNNDRFFTNILVGTERLELSHLAALEPKSSASTNSATSPNFCLL